MDKRFFNEIYKYESVCITYDAMSEYVAELFLEKIKDVFFKKFDSNFRVFDKRGILEKSDMIENYRSEVSKFVRTIEHFNKDPFIFFSPGYHSMGGMFEGIPGSASYASGLIFRITNNELYISKERYGNLLVPIYNGTDMRNMIIPLKINKIIKRIGIKESLE